MDPIIDNESPRAGLALLLQQFSELHDDREAWRVVYPIEEVLLLVTCATIASCDDFDAIVLFRRPLRALGARSFQSHRCRPVRPPLLKAGPPRSGRGSTASSPLTGKPSSRTNATGLKACTHCRPTPPTPVPEKTHEITAIPDLLDQLAEARQLTGALVTIDVIGCQVDIADKSSSTAPIICWGLQGNQPILEADTGLYFDAAPEASLPRKRLSKQAAAASRRRLRGFQQRRLDQAGSKLSRRAANFQHQDARFTPRFQHHERPRLRDAIFHLVGAVRYRAPLRRQRGHRGRKHALAARCRFKGRT
jgi:predicted transposase YbfD/YdcC